MVCQHIYGVWDDVSESYLAVFVLPDDGSAIRCFRDACLDPASRLAKDPICYSLRRFADLDSGSGSCVPVNPPVRLCRAFDHIGFGGETSVAPPSGNSSTTASSDVSDSPHSVGGCV